MLRRNSKGFTLIELMIVVAIIGILAAIAIPMYRAQACKSRLSEVTRGMNSVGGALGDYYNDNADFPNNDLTDATAIKNTLLVGLAVGGNNKIGGITVHKVSNTQATITCDVNNCCADVDSGSLILTANVTGTGAITWTWSGSNIPSGYIPKK